MNVHEITPGICVNCGRLNDMATNVTADELPTEGDATICFHCGHLMVFNADLSLRDLTDDEIMKWAGHPDLVAVNNARARLISGDDEEEDEWT